MEKKGFVFGEDKVTLGDFFVGTCPDYFSERPSAVVPYLREKMLNAGQIAKSDNNCGRNNYCGRKKIQMTEEKYRDAMETQHGRPGVQYRPFRIRDSDPVDLPCTDKEKNITPEGTVGFEHIIKGKEKVGDVSGRLEIRLIDIVDKKDVNPKCNGNITECPYLVGREKLYISAIELHC